MGIVQMPLSNQSGPTRIESTYATETSQSSSLISRTNSSSSSARPTVHTIASIPTDVLLVVFEHLPPTAVVCFGLANKTFWEISKRHLVAKELYPIWFSWPGSLYEDQQHVFRDLPYRLKAWMAPRILFVYSWPPIFVATQERHDYLEEYFWMVKARLGGLGMGSPDTDLEYLHLDEYRISYAARPECEDLFEMWKKLEEENPKFSLRASDNNIVA